MARQKELLSLPGALGLLLIGLLLAFPDQGTAHRTAVAAPGGSTVTVDVDLPSTSTGTPGGTLAVRVVAPGAGQARYPQGAPVVVYVPGSSGSGQLKLPMPDAEDIVQITFLFPGGVDPGGRTSDGTYDYRGRNSIAALRDVILYAAGLKAAADGRTIDQVVPVTVLHQNIGLLGVSNGGNIAVAVAAQHGKALDGYLRYIVQWESPVSSQIATVDLGGIYLDCPPGRRPMRMDVTNPRYRAYGSPVLDVDYSQLAYDPGDPRHPIFLDGDGDGRYTTVRLANGCRTPDTDGNRTLDMDEDWPLRGFTDGVRWVYSRAATQAMADLDLFGGSWPAEIATVAQANAFWDLREAVRLYGDALTNIPDLEGMVLASPVDHVQAAVDHPHIRQAFEGWDAAGAWVQINPSPDYLVEVDSRLAGRTDLPDNGPNTPPGDWSDPSGYTVPEDVPPVVLQMAAVYQMADRVQDATTSPTPTPTRWFMPTRPPILATPTPTSIIIPPLTPPPTPIPQIPPIRRIFHRPPEPRWGGHGGELQLTGWTWSHRDRPW